MRQILCLSFLSFLITSLHAQNSKETYHPYQKFGDTKIEILTLSNGKYNEFFDTDTIEIIGSAVLNTKTMKVIGFVEKDTTYSEATLDPTVVSRWLSPDLLAAKYPSLNPYNFTANNPILLIEVDGNWFAKFDNPNDPKQLVFVAEDGDNLATLEIQMGLKPGSLENSQAFKGMEIKVGTELSTQLNSISAVKQMNKLLSSEDLEVMNCSNFALGTNGIKQDNAWTMENGQFIDDGRSPEILGDAEKIIQKRFSNISEGESKTGDIITFGYNKEFVKEQLEFEWRREVSNQEVNEQTKGAGISHYGVVLLKSRDGSGVSQYIEKPGKGSVKISNYNNAAGETFEPRGSGEDSSAIYRKE